MNQADYTHISLVKAIEQRKEYVRHVNSIINAQSTLKSSRIVKECSKKASRHLNAASVERAPFAKKYNKKKDVDETNAKLLNNIQKIEDEARRGNVLVNKKSFLKKIIPAFKNTDQMRQNQKIHKALEGIYIQDKRKQMLENVKEHDLRVQQLNSWKNIRSSNNPWINKYFNSNEIRSSISNPMIANQKFNGDLKGIDESKIGERNIISSHRIVSQNNGFRKRNKSCHPKTKLVKATATLAKDSIILKPGSKISESFQEYHSQQKDDTFITNTESVSFIEGAKTPDITTLDEKMKDTNVLPDLNENKQRGKHKQKQKFVIGLGSHLTYKISKRITNLLKNGTNSNSNMKKKTRSAKPLAHRIESGSPLDISQSEQPLVEIAKNHQSDGEYDDTESNPQHQANSLNISTGGRSFLTLQGKNKRKKRGMKTRKSVKESLGNMTINYLGRDDYYPSTARSITAMDTRRDKKERKKEKMQKRRNKMKSSILKINTKDEILNTYNLDERVISSKLHTLLQRATNKKSASSTKGHGTLNASCHDTIEMKENENEENFPVKAKEEPIKLDNSSEVIEKK